MTPIAGQTPSPQLRIAIIGAGQVGRTFAAGLAGNGGHAVAVVAQAAHGWLIERLMRSYGRCSMGRPASRANLPCQRSSFT